MLTLHTKLPPGGPAPAIAAQLVLPYELREKCRLRAVLSTGEDVGVFTVRGTVLRDGDLLHGEDSGVVVQVVAAREPTYKVTCADAHTLLRCAFHLGNRHTQAQVGDGFLRIRADAVLKDMLAGLGATVIAEDAAFEPESGAYGGGHSHGEHGGHPLAPIPLRQKIHRPGDATAPHSESTAQVDKPRRVVPAQAGTHRPRECTLSMDSRLRGNDMMLVADTVLVAPVPDDTIAATIPDDAATRVP